MIDALQTGPTIGSLVPINPIDPGSAVDMVPGGSGIVGMFVVLFIAAVGFGIWRMTVVNAASKSLGLTDEQRLLAVTDEHAGAAIVAGAIVGDALAARSGTAVEGGDLTARLTALQSALDQGLISVDEFATARQTILDRA